MAQAKKIVQQNNQTSIQPKTITASPQSDVETNFSLEEVQAVEEIPLQGSQQLRQDQVLQLQRMLGNQQVIQRLSGQETTSTNNDNLTSPTPESAQTLTSQPVPEVIEAHAQKEAQIQEQQVEQINEANTLKSEAGNQIEQTDYEGTESEKTPFITPEIETPLGESSISSQLPTSITDSISNLTEAPYDQFNEATNTLLTGITTQQTETQQTLQNQFPTNAPILSLLKPETDVDPLQERITTPETQKEVSHLEPTETTAIPTKEAQQGIHQQMDGAKASYQATQAEQSQQMLTKSSAPTTTGPRPKVNLTGGANPAYVDAQQITADQTVTEQTTHLEATVNQEFGENELFSPQETATTTFDLELPTPPDPPEVSFPVPQNTEQQEALTQQVEEMQTQYEAHQDAYTTQLDEMQSANNQAFEAMQTGFIEQQLIIQQETHEEVSNLRAEWQTSHQSNMQAYQSEVATLRNDAHQFVSDNVLKSEGRANSILSQAEQQASQRKMQGEQKAQEQLNAGKQAATNILSGVNLGFSGQYESNAVQGIIMRQELLTPEKSEEEVLQEREEAITQAQASVDDAVSVALAEIQALELELNDILTNAEQMTEEELQATVDAIYERLTVVNAIVTNLATQVQADGDTNAAQAIMRINMSVVQAMGRVFALAEEKELATDAFYDNVAQQYQNTVGQSQQETFYIFVPANTLDSSDITGGNYPNMPYSELTASLMNTQGIDPSQVMYFENYGEATWNWGDNLNDFMNTVSLLNSGSANEGTEFVLGGHSSSGRAVADAAYNHVESGQQGSNPIAELLLFDPHVNYDPQAFNVNLPEFTGEQAEAVARNMEVSVFWSDWAYTGNNADGEPGQFPHPREWGQFAGNYNGFYSDTEPGFVQGGPQILPLGGLSDGTNAGNSHYWIVGNMGQDAANAVADSATNRKDRAFLDQQLDTYYDGIDTTQTPTPAPTTDGETTEQPPVATEPPSGEIAPNPFQDYDFVVSVSPTSASINQATPATVISGGVNLRSATAFGGVAEQETLIRFLNNGTPVIRLTDPVTVTYDEGSSVIWVYIEVTETEERGWVSTTYLGN